MLRFADHRNPDSLASRLRRKRYAAFEALLATVPRPFTMLDVGGTADFWRRLSLPDGAIKIVVLNREREAVDEPYLESVAGDARDLGAFASKSIDIVYSNSVIEHVGSFDDQTRMAKEVRRVGRRYYVQTPNVFFPIEPHFLVPGYQFMPVDLRAYLLTKFKLGWFPREPDWDRARAIAGAIRLLSESEMARLFPEASLERERFAGLTKSIVVHHGW